MNIAVQTYSGCIQCRPDTSWEREDKDLYAPDFVDGYLFSPVLFARICKAGKCIGRKFAGRYYDAINYGILLYAVLHSRNDGREMSDLPSARADDICHIMDRTSVLPSPMYDRATLESGENMFRLMCGTETEGIHEIYATDCGSCQMIESAIEEMSGLVSLRIGDIAAVELAQASHLISRGDCLHRRVSGTFCENALFDFNIIM